MIKSQSNLIELLADFQLFLSGKYWRKHILLESEKTYYHMKKVDNLQAWRLFCAALETGNLTQASIQVDVDTAAASRLLDGLEDELGVRLLYRNRRPFIATDEGNAVYEEVVSIVRAHEKLMGYFHRLPRTLDSSHQRAIVISAAQGFGNKWLMQQLLEYMRLFPNVTFNTLMEKSLQDLSSGKIDVLLPFYRIVRQGYVIKPYAIVPCLPLASPKYIKQYGLPQKPEDLVNHVGLRRSGLNFLNNRLITDGNNVKAMNWGKEIKNENSMALIQLATEGQGIVMDLPLGFFIEEIRERKLVPVLGKWRRSPYYLSVVTTEKKYKEDKEIKKFVDWMAVAEGKASNSRTKEALRILGFSTKDAFSDEKELTDPINSFWKTKSFSERKRD